MSQLSLRLQSLTHIKFVQVNQKKSHKGRGGERVDVECGWKVSGLGMQYRVV